MLDKSGIKSSDIRIFLQNKTSYFSKYKWIIAATLMMISIGLFNSREQIILTTSNVIYNSKPHPYQITPILDDIKKGKGVVTSDIDLCQIFETSSANQIKSTISKIKSDVYKYEFIMFKHQCQQNNFIISPETFTLIASQFGEISHYSTSKKHPAEPSGTDITVLSNDPTKGHRTTGSQGWHVDGSNKAKPDGIVFQYIMTAPNNGYGGTQIISSEAMIDLMKETNIELYNRLNRLYMGARNSEKPARIHPLIGKHPITNKEYMCIHTAYTKGFIEIKDESLLVEMDKLFMNQRLDDAFIEKYENDNRIKKIYSVEETKELLDVIIEFIENDCKDNGLVYVTDYEDGDLLIRDNWALLHTSHPSAQLDPEEVGLRVMWRITTAAEFSPSKF